MNRIKQLTVVSALGLLAPVAQASLIDLVTNGEFETHASKSTWKNSGWIKADTVPGWTSSEGHIELWRQGVMKSPSLGTDSLPTGQHAETTGDSQGSVLSTEFTVPGNYDAGKSGLLSFDVWNRAGAGVAVEITPATAPVAGNMIIPTCMMIDGFGSGCAQLQGDLIPAAIGPITNFAAQVVDSGARSNWIRFEQSVEVMAGASYTLSFTGLGGGTSGAHIDQVSFLVNTLEAGASALVPAPAPLALLLLGTAGLMGNRLRGSRMKGLS